MKNKSVYIRLTITYLAVFILPLMLNVFVLEDIARTTESEICGNVLVNLQHARDTVDSTVNSLNQTVANLTASGVVREAAIQLDKENKKVRISTIRDAQTLLKAAQNENFVSEYYLYLTNSEMVLSNRHVFLNQDDCRFFFQYNDLTWDEWMTTLDNVKTLTYFPSANVLEHPSIKEKFLMVEPLLYLTGKRGYFVFPIQTDVVRSLMTDRYIPDAGWAYLSDASGQILVSVPQGDGELNVYGDEEPIQEEIRQVTVDGKPMRLIRTVSAENGFVYTALLSGQYVTEKIREAQQKTIGLIVTVVLAGAVVIMLISLRRGRKIVRTMRILFKAEGIAPTHIHDELGYISESCARLVEKNEGMEESIRRQEPVTKGLLLQSLLWGTISEPKKQLEEFGIHMEKKQILLMTMQFSIHEESAGSAEMLVYKQYFMEKLIPLLSADHYECDTSVSARTLFFCMNEEQQEKWNEKKQQIAEKIEQASIRFEQEYGVFVRIACASSCAGLEQISKEYDALEEMLLYSDGEQRLLLKENTQKEQEYYYYPIMLEERLLNAVKSGDSESVHRQLKEVYETNVIDRNISPSMMHFMVNNLECTVFKVMHSLKNQVEIDEKSIFDQLALVNQETDILLRFQRINAIFGMLCEAAKPRENGQEQRQKQEIEAYIREHYSDSDMGLAKAAEQFGYAGSYFSRLFKDLFGENFASYLERIRMEEICTLLTQTKDTLEQIAGKTGYNSVSVMRTAFKRMKGITPNEYRKQHQNE